ncbi:MAG: SPOR domain-containing protein [Candidatus Omnitrophica bacterium]|nr:SPOR domain-containing protein [Candidatus Omnitrophota bacterium]
MEKGQLSFFAETKKEKRKIAISLDKLYLTCVLLVISLIVCFSLGIEKGKRINAAKAPESGFEPSTEISLKPIESRKIIDNTTKPADTPKKVIPKTASTQKEPLKKLEEEESPTKKPNLYYSIQVASYNRADIAQAEAERLKNKGFGPVIIKKGKYIALCVGRFEAYSEAKTLAKSLKTYYSDCFVRKL